VSLVVKWRFASAGLKTGTFFHFSYLSEPVGGLWLRQSLASAADSFTNIGKIVQKNIYRTVSFNDNNAHLINIKIAMRHANSAISLNRNHHTKRN
jgi:hypothetical protein